MQYHEIGIKYYCISKVRLCTFILCTAQEENRMLSTKPKHIITIKQNKRSHLSRYVNVQENMSWDWRTTDFPFHKWENVCIVQGLAADGDWSQRHHLHSDLLTLTHIDCTQTDLLFWRWSWKIKASHHFRRKLFIMMGGIFSKKQQIIFKGKHAWLPTSCLHNILH